MRSARRYRIIRPVVTRAVVVGATAVSLGATAFTSPVLAATTGDVVMNFEQSSARASTGIDLSATVITANGGETSFTRSRATQGNAIEFPQHDASRSGDRAVLKVANTTSTDRMNPGSRDFSWGADFLLFAKSYDTSESSYDNGDNLVQRGLSGTKHQFKLEIDRGKPACAVENSVGRAFRVALSTAVQTGTWHSATCARNGTTLKLTVTRFDAQGAVASIRTTSRTESGGFGTITWSDPKAPLTVGGKLNSTGTHVNTRSDQFNGRVDNVFLDID